MNTSTDQTELSSLQSAAAGNQTSWENLISPYRDKLKRIVAFRMDMRLQGRIDPSDVIQETFLEAWQRLPAFVSKPDVPFFVWLRALAQQRLGMLRREHLERDKRTVMKEVPIRQDDSSSAIAIAILDKAVSPSEAVQQHELFLKVQAKLEEMEPMDREVLALRHFEQLTNLETANVLGLTEPAASQRYARALKRLKTIISEIKGLSSGTVS